MTLSPDQLVCNLPLSTRARNGFKRAGITNVSDLLRCTEGDLREIPCFGVKTIVEIKTFLRKEGLSLGVSADDTETLWNDSTLPEGESRSSGGSCVACETIDDEFVRVLEAAVEAKHHQIILYRHGWLGKDVLTLDEIAQDPDVSGLETIVTRERIRQIQSKAEGRIRAFWALNRPEKIVSAIAFLEDVAPIAKKDVTNCLLSAGFIRAPISYEGLRRAAKLGKLSWRFLELFRSETVIAETSAYSREDIQRIEGAILSATKRMPFSNLEDVVTGSSDPLYMSYVANIIDAHSDLYWLDERRSCFWHKPHSSPKKNKIIFVCGKLFSLKREASLSELLNAVARARTVDKCPTAEVLENLLVRSGLFQSEVNKIVACEGVEFDNLNETDRKVLRAARSLGRTVQFIDLRNNLVREGLSSGYASVEIQLSPLLIKIARGKYRVIVDPTKVDERLLSDNTEKHREQASGEAAIVYVKVGAKEKLTGTIAAEIPDKQWLAVLAQEPKPLQFESINGKLIGLKALFASFGVVIGDTLKLVFDFESGKVSVSVVNV